jgi:hypothetical protein
LKGDGAFKRWDLVGGSEVIGGLEGEIDGFVAQLATRRGGASKRWSRVRGSDVIRGVAWKVH